MKPAPLTPEKQDLVSQHLDLVPSIARLYRRRVSLQWDDLVGEGNLALCEAAQRYDAEKGDFRGYAAAWITGCLAAAIAREIQQPATNAADLDQHPAREEIDAIEEVRGAIARLSPDEQTLLFRRFGLVGEPESEREIARQNGQSRNTVQKIRRRGIDKVRQACA